MVPSIKFTLVAWVAIIGLGSLSFVLKDKKHTTRKHPGCRDRFRSATNIQRQNQYPGLLYAQSVNGNLEFVAFEEGNAMAGSK